LAALIDCSFNNTAFIFGWIGMSHNNQNKRREEIFHDSEESEPEEDQEEGEIID